MSDSDKSEPAIVGLVEEIQSLSQKYIIAKAEGGERRSDTYFYKTALRIAKARQKWEQEPLLKDRPFFQTFRVGFVYKKVVIFQVENGRWCGSYVPWNKYYGDTVEEILKKLLDISW